MTCTYDVRTIESIAKGLTCGITAFSLMVRCVRKKNGIVCKRCFGSRYREKEIISLIVLIVISYVTVIVIVIIIIVTIIGTPAAIDATTSSLPSSSLPSSAPPAAHRYHHQLPTPSHR